MRRSIAFTSLFLLLLFLCIPGFAQGQQKSDPAARPKPQTSSLSAFVQGNYFGPKLSDVNSVYSSIEQYYQLPAGHDFKGIYDVLVGVRYDLVPTQAVQGEFGFSILKAKHDSTSNYHQLFSAGGSYILKMGLDMVSIYGGGGVSYLWLNTERSYQTRLGIAHVNGQMVQLHALLGVEFLNPLGVSFALEGRYLYALTVSPKRSDLDFNLKGVTAGIRLGIPILF